MAGKKKGITAVDLVFAPVSIAVGVGKAINSYHKASLKEQERQEALRIRSEKQRVAEQAKRDRERAKKQKEADALKQKEQARSNQLLLQHGRLNDIYGHVLLRHDEISVQLSTKNDLNEIVILCKEDIELIPQLFDYYTRKSIIDGIVYPFPQYDSFLRLSLAYEKMHRYDQAVLACQQAMELGLANAGECGSMSDRIQSLKQQQREGVRSRAQVL